MFQPPAWWRLLRCASYRREPKSRLGLLLLVAKDQAKLALWCPVFANESWHDGEWCVDFNHMAEFTSAIINECETLLFTNHSYSAHRIYYADSQLIGTLDQR
jgi:hypothetical protein